MDQTEHPSAPGKPDGGRPSLAGIFRGGLAGGGAGQTGAPRAAGLSAAEEATLGVDEAGIVRYSSPGAEALFRTAAAFLDGQPLSGLVPRLRFNAVTPGFNRLLATFWSARRGWLRLEGRSEARGIFPVDVSLASVHVGAARLFIVTLRDAAPCRSSGDAVRRLTAAFAESEDAVMLTDAQGVIEYVNARFERVTGFRSEEAVGRTPRILNSGTHPPGYFATLWATLRAGKEFRDIVVNRRKDGSLFHEEASIRPLFDDAGVLTHYLSVGRDVSERVREMARLERLAHYDELTALANRSLFRDRLGQAVVRAERHRTGFALLYLDLDDFKALNDAYGHACGDAALQEVARRLSGCLREEDTVARIGGDEFAVILVGAADVEALQGPLQKIVAALRGAIAVGGRVATLGASVGVCMYPGQGGDEAELMRAADAAMYRAKAQGGGYVVASANGGARASA